uniref:Uncharacterized protein n=1 Tax=Oryza nivara TaxID=4536 RepID=A0A0E0H958_ORYNI
MTMTMTTRDVFWVVRELVQDTQAKPDQVRIHVALAHPLVVGLGCAEQGRRYGIEDLRITLNQKIWTNFPSSSGSMKARSFLRARLLNSIDLRMRSMAPTPRCLASDSESSGNGARGTQVR